MSVAEGDTVGVAVGVSATEACASSVAVGVAVSVAEGDTVGDVDGVSATEA